MSRQAVDASDNEAEWIRSIGEGERARDGKTRGAITDRRRREEARGGEDDAERADDVSDDRMRPLVASPPPLLLLVENTSRMRKMRRCLSVRRLALSIVRYGAA